MTSSGEDPPWGAPWAARKIVSNLEAGSHQNAYKQLIDVTSIRRLLKGPNNDWPLDLGDHRTVDPFRDSVKNDILFREVAGENKPLKHNDSHRWYYVINQDVEDILVSRNVQTYSDDSSRKQMRSGRVYRTDFKQ